MPKRKPFALFSAAETDTEGTPAASVMATPDTTQDGGKGLKRKRGAAQPAQAQRRSGRLSEASTIEPSPGPRPPLKDKANGKQLAAKRVGSQPYEEAETMLDDLMDDEPARKRVAKGSKKPVHNNRSNTSKPASCVGKENRVHSSSDTRDAKLSTAKSATPTQSVRSTRTQDCLSERRPLPRPVLSASKPRVVSTEATESEPQLRRKIGELTKRLETVESRYKTLRDYGIVEAEQNYDKLRKLSEAKAQAATKLIESLKKEVEMYRSIGMESLARTADTERREKELEEARRKARDLEGKLEASQKENRLLEGSLAKSRNTPVAMDIHATKTPRTMAQQTRAQPGTVEAAHISQIKEDLYTDLTGLILRSVELGDESDSYDCIQTGRNGTLHFKLTVAKDAEESYENTEFQYTPRLDENRDRDLIGMLPDYLADEIVFSRTNAAMFYGRVMDTLTKRRAVEES